MAKKTKPCDCVFCNSKCPECGSTEIHVEYTLKYEYDNDTEDSILVPSPEVSLTLQCFNCGYWNPGNSDDRLKLLSKALWEHLGVQPITFIHHKDHGEIETKVGVLRKERV